MDLLDNVLRQVIENLTFEESYQVLVLRMVQKEISDRGSVDTCGLCCCIVCLSKLLEGGGNGDNDRFGKSFDIFPRLLVWVAMATWGVVFSHGLEGTADGGWSSHEVEFDAAVRSTWRIRNMLGLNRTTTQDSA